MTVLTEGVSWEQRGLCRPHPADWWFPEDANGGRAGNKARAGQAIAICQACDVQVQCLETALARPLTADHGIWGGTTAQERMYIRQRRQQ